jgi:hypothetical protein
MDQGRVPPPGGADNRHRGMLFVRVDWQVVKAVSNSKGDGRDLVQR